MLTLTLLAGCGGPQSSLSVAGVEAGRIGTLFWSMSAGALLIWTAVMGIALYAARAGRRHHEDDRTARRLIMGGGVIFPVIVLALLLIYTLPLLPIMRSDADVNLRIAVTGERWWWRVQYLTDAGAVELANEIRLPVGRRVEFSLGSPDVIHSFWVPSLGGKMDMVPGRVTRLVLEPTRAGQYRGVCAEYCGGAHALMNFIVIVMEPQAFTAWLNGQAAPSLPALDEESRAGQAAFMANGCGACHTVRGTPADGVIGPDLTHVGSRLSLGAGNLPNDKENLQRWISSPEHLKPGVTMPAFGMLPEQQIGALAAYLAGLQ